jgi:hypothetical protein
MARLNVEFSILPMLAEADKAGLAFLLRQVRTNLAFQACQIISTNRTTLQTKWNRRLTPEILLATPQNSPNLHRVPVTLPNLGNLHDLSPFNYSWLLCKSAAVDS